MDYEDTKIEKVGNYCFLLLAGIMVYSIVNAIINYFLDKSNNVELLWTVLLLIPFLAIFIGIPFVNIRNAKRNRELARLIKENGYKVNGTIKKIEKTANYDYKNSLFKRASFFRKKKAVSYGGTSSKKNYYSYAVVEYDYKGKKKIVNTPSLLFTKEDLKGKDVDVFVYDDKVYVDNFNIKREEITRKVKKWNHMKLKVALSFIAIFILMGDEIYLVIAGLIPKEYIAYILGGTMAIYLIVASIIYINYINDVFNKEDCDE